MPKKIGLALGGGGARGWAHVGVLRALEDYQIPIHYIAGTSIGAMVGAIYARNALHRLEQYAENIGVDNLLALMDISFPGLGLLQGDRVRDFLSGYLLDAAIEDCQIPFRCVATNFLRKEEVVFESGSMVDAVRASISLPGIFVPFNHQDACLVDGGVVNPVPVSVVRDMGADAIIAVNLNRDPKTRASSTASAEPQDTSSQSSTSLPSDSSAAAGANANAGSESQAEDTSGSNSAEAPGFAEGLVDRYQNFKALLQDQLNGWMPDPQTGMNIFDVIGNSINMMEQQVTTMNLHREAPDVLIEPNLMEFGIFDFQQAQAMIQKGYEATQAQIGEIKQQVTQ